MGMFMDESLKVMVLAGGPDREREVSLQSGEGIANGLREAGHDVTVRDIGPGDFTCLDEFESSGGDVIFPALHGSWGEGGPLQAILEQRGLPFVGCGYFAADLCMDKVRTKAAAREAGIPTAAFELLNKNDPCSLKLPLVIKPVREGSSIDLKICHTQEEVDAGRDDLFQRHGQLMFEQFISGSELTIGVIGDVEHPQGRRALPIIQIVPATAFYDYQAKYVRDDTQYRFDIDLPGELLLQLALWAEQAFDVLGGRDLSRVDFMVDKQTHEARLLEVNTLPGFTSHSLLPMAANHAGMPMAKLVDHLVKLAAARVRVSP